jgi:hypothetical protein
MRYWRLIFQETAKAQSTQCRLRSILPCCITGIKINDILMGWHIALKENGTLWSHIKIRSSIDDVDRKLYAFLVLATYLDETLLDSPASHPRDASVFV